MAQASDFEVCAFQDGGVQVMAPAMGAHRPPGGAFAGSVEYPVAARLAKSKQLFDQELISRTECETR